MILFNTWGNLFLIIRVYFYLLSIVLSLYTSTIILYRKQKRRNNLSEIVSSNFLVTYTTPPCISKKQKYALWLLLPIFFFSICISKDVFWINLNFKSKKMYAYSFPTNINWYFQLFIFSLVKLGIIQYKGKQENTNYKKKFNSICLYCEFCEESI